MGRMSSTGWMHIGVVLLAFAAIAALALRRIVLPAPKEPPPGETVGGASGYAGGGASPPDSGGHAGGF